jgi:hypothetical protein
MYYCEKLFWFYFIRYATWFRLYFINCFTDSLFFFVYTLKFLSLFLVLILLFCIR